MAGLIDLATAKLHLRITDSDHDSDVQLKADQASAVVLDYVVKGRSRWDDPLIGLTAGDLDPNVQAAMLDVLSALYEHRGDDYGVDNPDGALWEAITRRLARLRDPALA